MRSLVIAGFALGLMAGTAAAADMPVPYTKAPPPREFSWTGLYVGGNAGWLQLEDNGYPFCLDPTGAMQGLGCDIVPGGQMGAFGGGQAGYNWQTGKLVLGIEADMQGVDLKVPVHMRYGWRARKNLSTGIVMATVSGVLVVTAFGLYYFGAEGARAVAGEVHTRLGVASPVLLIAHIWWGRRG
jgi:opacity protein-like surface antigen